MTEEIKLTKRSKQERLAIANTLIDSVVQENPHRLIADCLSRCMEEITACIELIGEGK